MIIPPYFCDKNINSVMQQLKQRSNFASEWFKDDNMKMSTGKCRLFVS